MVRPRVPVLLLDTSIVLDSVDSRQLLFCLTGSNVQDLTSLVSSLTRLLRFNKSVSKEL